MLRTVLIAALLLGLSACAGQNRFVLLEEEDGSVGAITVQNQGGSQTIAQAGEGTQVASAEAAPSEPAAVSAEEIQQTWGPALGASPLKPRSFQLYFVTGTDILTEESRRQLPDILASIQEYPAPEVSVTGHTDTVGRPDSNERLALDRAEAIRSELVRVGIDRALIEVTSHGESNLLVPTPDNTDEPRNRRVEVQVR
jgi:outer membrane protein OmpA-like peptidoglycan-associated protein